MRDETTRQTNVNTSSATEIGINDISVFQLLPCAMSTCSPGRKGNNHERTWQKLHPCCTNLANSIGVLKHFLVMTNSQRLSLWKRCNHRTDSIEGPQANRSEGLTDKQREELKVCNMFKEENNIFGVLLGRS